MLDPQMERRHHEERWKRVRAEVVAERLQDAADASVDASANAIRRLWRVLSWQPERMRHRFILGIPGLALSAILLVLAASGNVPFALVAAGLFAPVILSVLIGIVVRNHAARREHEEALTSRQRGAR